MWEPTAREAAARAAQFEAEAHRILSAVETAGSRVVLLNDSYDAVANLSVKQDDLLRQALRCAEHELYRAAHVMAWAALMDYVQEKLASDGLTTVRKARPKWKFTAMEDLREYQSDYQFVDVAREVGLCGKSVAKALHGLLNKRNECAHPSDYYPNLNETLGYISEVLQRIEYLAGRSYPP